MPSGSATDLARHYYSATLWTTRYITPSVGRMSKCLPIMWIAAVIMGMLLLMSTEADISADANSNRYAMIVTLAGPNKLSSYFEWTCRTIGHAASKFDMLVFHESNIRLNEIKCASNVKFYDLGTNGLSKLIVSEILAGFNVSSEDTRGQLTNMLGTVIQHIPRYLIEVKPMSGSLFRKYLSDYSHWTYTDPDIIWGNVANWIDPRDAESFDIITLAKINDAGRLFIRGQFALHKNIARINTLWKDLHFFVPNAFAKRVATAVKLIEQKKSSDTIFSTCFHSAEGYYSQLVFQKKTLVKIIGRGYDDFSKDPVVVGPTGLLLRSKRAELGNTISGMLANPSDLFSASGDAVWNMSPVSVKHNFFFDICSLCIKCPFMGSPKQ